MSDIYHTCLYNAQGNITCSYQKKPPVQSFKSTISTLCNISPIEKSSLGLNIKSVENSELMQNW